MTEKRLLLLLRLAIGWFFLYSGVTKVFDPTWSAAGYLTNAQTFGWLYQWFASSQLLPIINVVNSWGQLLLGISLITGLYVRQGGVAGAILMLLYYFPILKFPFAGEHALLIDEHIIYAIALLYLSRVNIEPLWKTGKGGEKK
ncbi:MAG: DoxX family membrane protein [Candidatus Levybacteria bacterium]|nr:DoxX family membrane protein [Candidatus Levybacteria bacterium]